MKLPLTGCRWRTPLAFLTLAAVTLSAAAASRNARYTQLEPEVFLTSWLVLSPIPVSQAGSPDLDTQKKAFSRDFLASGGGESGVAPSLDARITIDGRDFQWRLIDSPSDAVDLQSGAETNEYSVAYAWAEITMSEPRKIILGIGSDDAVKVWVNGSPVHEFWVTRSVETGIYVDAVPVALKAGRNTVLLKVQNAEGGWGFSCRRLGPEAQAAALMRKVRAGDLDAVERLIEHGVDLNLRDPSGLTAVQLARLRGQKELVDFLAGKGADADAPTPPPESLARTLMESVAKPDGPGAAVLVARDGKILFEAGFGLASMEHQVPNTPATRFRIGSITKQFAAAAILKLVEQGKLSLDDKLSKFIGDFPRGDEVTVHHLLTHTSGIHSYTSEPDFFKDVTVGTTTEELIDSFKNDPYDFDPGTKWAYNNSGYFLLGYIIEKVSGETYGEYLQHTFFDPLGMTNTGVHRITEVIPHEATGYSFENGRTTKALNWDMSKAGAAGALYSTVGDLHLWNEAVFGGKVIRQDLLDAAFSPVRLLGEDSTTPKESGYGYGWSILTLRGAREISHSGGLHGFSSYLMRLPEHNFTVAVLANCAPALPGLNPPALSRELAEFFLSESLAPRPVTRVAKAISAESLDALAGRYDYGGAVLTVTRRENRLFAQITGQPEFEIYPRNETNYFWKVVEAEISFAKDAEGRVSKAVHRQGGQTIDAPKLPDISIVEVDPEKLDAIAGRYDYGGGLAVMTVTHESRRVFAQITGQPKFEIFPVSEAEFVWKIVNARVAFVADENGRIIKAVHTQSGRTFDAPRLE